jgi:hypothetical protein
MSASTLRRGHRQLSQTRDIATFLGRLTSEEARQYYDRYIGPYFNSDGRADLAIAQPAVAAELGVASPSADQMY